jgi:peroxin-19
MQNEHDKDDDGGADDDDDELEAMFASELAKEMEKMLGGLKPSNDNVPAFSSGKPDTGNPEKEPESEEERQFRETFEKILANSMPGGTGGSSEDDNGDVDLEQLSKLMNGLGAGGLPDFDALTKSNPSSSSKAKTAQPQPPRTFEETIKATMSRLNESEASHQNKAKSADDPLAALMAQMEALGGGAGGAGFPGLNGKDGEEELPELLDGLMDQLMSKELLYEPITELRTKVSPDFIPFDLVGIELSV